MRAIATTLIIACVTCAFAGSGTQVASNNATVQATGPRTGTSGLKFFNVEGSGNGAFASFGVMDWTASSFGLGTVTSINSCSIDLTESNASFTTAGTVHFYFATNTAVSIMNDGTSPLKYGMDGTHNANGVDNQLGTLIDLGTGLFNTTGNVNSGQDDSYSFTINTTVGTYLTAALNNPSGVIRLVVAGEESVNPKLAATWAGYTNTSMDANGRPYKPTMTINATSVPEPGSIAVIVLGGLGLLRRRSRK